MAARAGAKCAMVWSNHKNSKPILHNPEYPFNNVVSTRMMQVEKLFSIYRTIMFVIRYEMGWTMIQHTKVLHDPIPQGDSISLDMV